MQESTTLARPYAQAAFEQAQEDGELQSWSEMLALLKIIVSDAQMQRLLANPALDAAFLSGFVLDLAGAHFSAGGKNFIKALASARRLNLGAEIARLYEQQRRQAEGLVEVGVISAYRLDAKEQERIAKLMHERLGKEISLRVRIDESLIGGAVIRAGDSVIDASVKGRLKQLGNELAE